MQTTWRRQKVLCKMHSGTVAQRRRLDMMCISYLLRRQLFLVPVLMLPRRTFLHLDMRPSPQYLHNKNTTHNTPSPA